MLCHVSGLQDVVSSWSDTSTFFNCVQKHTNLIFRRLQAIAYGKKYGLPVLRWVNPVRNCDDKEYSVETIEALLPGAVQYFVVGAPANIIQNHNPVATGIVNGTRVLMHSLVWANGYRWQPPPGSKPGHVHHVPRPAYVVVVPDVDGEEDSDKNVAVEGAEDFPKKVAVEGEEVSRKKVAVNDLIPLQLEPDEDSVQGVKLSYKSFPYDLGFAMTYHKVQGQTMRRVIMFLHQRKSRQLAKLQWESLYVAMTRVKCGNDMRVCYCGSEVKTVTRHGLQHLKKLTRPKLYDVWQAAYDERGYWDGSNLEKEAVKTRKKLRQKLSKVSRLTRTSLRKLKEWSAVLDVVVKCKPGTTSRNKPQYLDAIKPIWAACRGGNVRSDCEFKKREKNKEDSRRRKRLSPPSPGDTSLNSSHDSFPPESSLPCLEAADITQHHRQLVRQQRVFIKRQFLTLSPQTMERRMYARVGDIDISFAQFYHLAVKANFIDNFILGLMLRKSCPLAHIPTYMTETRGINNAFCPNEDTPTDEITAQRIRAESWVNRIETGRVLMLPYNWPVNLHWVAVFVWKSGSQYHVQPRNSYRLYAEKDVAILKHAMNLMSKMYRFCKRPEPRWDRRTAIVEPPTITEQNPNECALHVVANGVLAQMDQCFSHTFDNNYVDNIRSRYIVLLANCRRDTTTRNVVQTTHNSAELHHNNKTRKIREMRAQLKYFRTLKSQEKYVEGRPDYPSYRNLVPGDIIRFKCGNRECDRVILSVHVYDNVKEMLLASTVQACLPHLSQTDIDKAVTEYHDIPCFKENVKRHNGVRAFTLQVGGIN